MGNRARREYLDAICERYRYASKKQKGAILDECCHVCSYNRKYAIRVLRQRFSYLSKSRAEQDQSHGRRPGRPKQYNDPAIVEFLTVLWRAMNLACSKRIKAAIPYWLPSYDRPLKGHTLTLLMHISAATIDRLLRGLRSRYSKLGLATTKPGSLLKKHIPINTNQWDEQKPGYLEADTVAHCGSSMAGMFVFTLNCTDIATGWTEHRATWGKGEQGVLRAIQSLEEALPFPLRGFDCDNGSEFLNWPLLKYFADRKRPVLYTRSREYYKNDNAHVEEKNWTHVRQYLGYQRFEDRRMVALMNDLYCSEWRLLMNFFLPQVKLIAKERIGSKTVKKHDKPQTPLQRLLASPHIPRKAKQQLRQQLSTLNPFTLYQQVSVKIKRILHLATPLQPGPNGLLWRKPSAMAKVKNKSYHNA